ncbi:MAG TPA: hypothetical protein VHT97_13960 [Acidimicrobiales bacterium]|nr:hypothetical protein [Acidimicrobiales bacterium]
MRFPFAFEPAYRVVALAFAITPATAWVDVAEGQLSARFGLWRISTPTSNVTGTQATGPYSVFRTIGAAHLSLADRGLTFATNRRRGLCITFADPVPGIIPSGALRHPGLTVTVADVDGLASALSAPAAAG